MDTPSRTHVHTFITYESTGKAHALRAHLGSILPGGDAREKMLHGYEDMENALGYDNAPRETARIMLSLLRGRTR